MSDIIEQGSAEWFEARLGLVTASQLTAVMSKGRGSAPSATRATYMAQLIAERLSGSPTEGFNSAAMQHGTDTEPQARAAYAMNRGQIVEEVGFVVHPIIKDSGASPDGMVGDNGLVEIKCPLTKTHLETLKTGRAPTTYIKQMQWQMACTGRHWCDFVSFDPRMPSNMRIKIIRVERDNALIAEMEAEVFNFIADMHSEIQALIEMYGKAA